MTAAFCLQWWSCANVSSNSQHVVIWDCGRTSPGIKPSAVCRSIQWLWIDAREHMRTQPSTSVSLRLPLQFLSHTYPRPPSPPSELGPLPVATLWLWQLSWSAAWKDRIIDTTRAVLDRRTYQLTWIDETEERVVRREAAVPLEPAMGATAWPLDGQHLWLQQALPAVTTRRHYEFCICSLNIVGISLQLKTFVTEIKAPFVLWFLSCITWQMGHTKCLAWIWALLSLEQVEEFGQFIFF